MLCRGCFLVFSVRAASYYICTRTHAGGGAPWVRAAGVGVEASTTASGSATAGGAGSWVLMVDPLRPSASSPLKRGQCRNAGGIIDGLRVVVPDDPRRAGCSFHGWSPSGARWVEDRGGAAGAGGRSSGRGGAREGPGHICGPNGPRCLHRARSVAAGFACEMGVFCGEVRLIFSILGVFLAVEWGSKRDWCEDLLIFSRKWLGDMRCFFVYYARGGNNRDNVMEIHCFRWGMRGAVFFALVLQM